MVAVRQGSLGQLRFVMKDGLQWLPLYGHYFYQHGCIYVRRGQFSQHKMMRGLEYLQNDRIQVGTRRDGTERDGAERDGAERDGTERDGTERDGTGRDGTEQDGTGRSETGRNGTGRSGTERDGTER